MSNEDRTDVITEEARVQRLGEIGLENFPPYLMNRIMGRYNADMQGALKDMNLSTVKMRTLSILAVVPGLTINELAVYAVTEQSTMSRTLEALESAGFVRRTERASDGRVREIYLTDEGRVEIDRVWPVMWNGYQSMREGIDPAEWQQFVSILQRVLRNVRQNEF